METKTVKTLLLCILCASFTIQAQDMLYEDLEDPAMDPLAFSSEELYEVMEQGVPYNTRAFVSGACTVLVTVANFPVFPLEVAHITMHVPDLLVNVSAQPFSSLWVDPAKKAQETILKPLLKALYKKSLQGAPISGGILSIKGKGLSETRSKDVEIYGNPWIAPIQMLASANWFGKKKPVPKLKLELESKKGFYELAKQSFPYIKNVGCITAFLPNIHVYNSEIDLPWRITVPGYDLLQAITLGLFRTVGPGILSLGPIGNAVGLAQVLSPFFPLKGTVTNAIHAHGAAVNALRAAYIATAGTFGVWTLHFPQYPDLLLKVFRHSCLSAGFPECQTFTSEEYKWGLDKVGLWQLVAPRAMEELPPFALPIDSEDYIEYLKLIDKLVPSGKTEELGFQAVNPGEKYSFLHWRCHKCCDIPEGLKGAVSVEVVGVIPGLNFATCESPIPPIDINAFKKLLKDKFKKLQEGKTK